MTVVAVGTWRGTGASTTALVLAAAGAAAGRAPWLIEADPAGGVLAGRSEQLAEFAGGLERVALPKPPVAPATTWPLAVSTLAGVGVVTTSGEPFVAWSCIAAPTVDWMASLRHLADLVVVDVGSLRGGPVPSWRVLDAADVVVVVTTAEPVAFTTSLDWCDTLGRTAPGTAGLVADTARLLVVDAPTSGPERFRPDRARADAGDRFAGWWPWEPATVDAVLRGGTLDHPRLARTGLARAAHATLDRIVPKVAAA